MWRGCRRLGCREGPGNQNIRAHGSEAGEEFPAAPIGCGAEWTVHLFSRASLFGYLSCASNELHGRPPTCGFLGLLVAPLYTPQNCYDKDELPSGAKRGGYPTPIFLQVFILGSLTHGSPSEPAPISGVRWSPKTGPDRSGDSAGNQDGVLQFDFVDRRKLRRDPPQRHPERKLRASLSARGELSRESAKRDADLFYATKAA